MHTQPFPAHDPVQKLWKQATHAAGCGAATTAEAARRRAARSRVIG
jgi:hypothetical protein